MRRTLFVIPVFLAVLFFCADNVTSKEKEEETMAKVITYEAKDFSRLLGTAGYSDTALNNHFKLYQGYVKNTNIVLEKLSVLSAEGKDRTPEFAELKRRFGWEFNGMRLHECYFENIGGKAAIDQNSQLYKKIADEFGSFDGWKQDFVSCGMMRGIGWVILYQDPANSRLVNVWINEHDVGHPAGASPVLVMDVFEHAYFTDYQTDRAKYIDAFLQSVDWKKANERLK